MGMSEVLSDYASQLSPQMQRDTHTLGFCHTLVVQLPEIVVEMRPTEILSLVHGYT